MAAIIAVLLAASPYDEAVTQALADINRVPPASRVQCRYLFATGEDDLVAASMAMGHLSRVRTIKPPRPVGNGVIRLQLASLYGLDGKIAKEVLAAWEALDEPYFTHRPTLQLAALQAATRSKYPIMRADAFVAQAVRPPAYYAFKGVPQKQDDLYKSLALDVKSVFNVRAQLEANISISKITEKPRRIVQMLAPFGPVFVTEDVFDEGNSSIVPAVIPKDYIFRFDAQEIYFLGSNGLWGNALYDKDGNRANAVPAGIATDRYGTSGHGEVVPMISCIRCHEREGSSNLQPFADNQVTVKSISGDPFEIQKLTDAHDPERMNDLVLFGGLANLKAVSRVTAGMLKEGDHVRSMTPSEATNNLVNVYENFIGGVDLEKAAEELFLTPEQMAAMLAGINHESADILKSGGTLTRKSWESFLAVLPF